MKSLVLVQVLACRVGSEAKADYNLFFTWQTDPLDEILTVHYCLRNTVQKKSKMNHPLQIYIILFFNTSMIKFFSYSFYDLQKH